MWKRLHKQSLECEVLTHVVMVMSILPTEISLISIGKIKKKQTNKARILSQLIFSLI